MEGGREQNFWPGFVDALSNVVLVMIFVVVVFVVTLFYYSQKLAEYKAHQYVEKRESEQAKHPATAGARDQANSDPVQRLSDSPQKPETPQPPQDAKDKQITELKTQVATLRVQLAGQAVASAVAAVTGNTRSENDAPNHLIEVKAGEKAKTTDTGARLESTAESIVLHFADDSTTLDPDAIKNLNNDVAAWVERLKKGPGKIVVSGAAGSLGYTEGRRRAYYRAIAVRNQMIALGVEPARVISRVVPGDATNDSGSRVLLQFTTQDPK
jgi:outer membrane protein OmpA-like peptidoglycan-associated protein